MEAASFWFLVETTCNTAVGLISCYNPQVNNLPIENARHIPCLLVFHKFSNQISHPIVDSKVFHHHQLERNLSCEKGIPQLTLGSAVPVAPGNPTSPQDALMDVFSLTSGWPETRGWPYVQATERQLAISVAHQELNHSLGVKLSSWSIHVERLLAHGEVLRS